RLRIGVRDHVGPAVLADILAVMADEAVALASHTVLYLAGCGELEALLHTALGLELGHFHLLGQGHVRPALAALSARPARELRVNEGRAFRVGPDKRQAIHRCKGRLPVSARKRAKSPCGTGISPAPRRRVYI